MKRFLVPWSHIPLPKEEKYSERPQLLKNNHNSWIYRIFYPMKEKRIMLLFSPQAQLLETCHTTYILFPGAKSYHIWTPVLLYVYSSSHERFRSNYLPFVFLSALEELLKNFAGRYATGDEVSFVCLLNFVFFSFLWKKRLISLQNKKPVEHILKPRN